MTRWKCLRIGLSSLYLYVFVLKKSILAVLVNLQRATQITRMIMSIVGDSVSGPTILRVHTRTCRWRSMKMTIRYGIFRYDNYVRSRHEDVHHSARNSSWCSTIFQIRILSERFMSFKRKPNLTDVSKFFTRKNRPKIKVNLMALGLLIRFARLQAIYKFWGLLVTE